MKILLLSGLPGAGKTTFAECFSKIVSCVEIVDSAKALSHWLDESYPRSRVGVVFVDRFGLGNVPIALSEAIDRSADELVVLDAVRHASTMSLLRQKYSASYSVFVKCPEPARLGRLTKRSLKRLGSQQAAEQAFHEYSEYDLQVKEVEMKADIVIENNGSIADLMERARETYVSIYQ